jgi:hypothetical protein
VHLLVLHLCSHLEVLSVVVGVPVTRVIDHHRKNAERGVLELLSNLDANLLECSARADLVRLHGGTLEAVHLDSLELWHCGSTSTVTIRNVADWSNGSIVLPS